MCLAVFLVMFRQRQALGENPLQPDDVRVDLSEVLVVPSPVEQKDQPLRAHERALLAGAEAPGRLKRIPPRAFRKRPDDARE